MPLSLLVLTMIPRRKTKAQMQLRPKHPSCQTHLWMHGHDRISHLSRDVVRMILIIKILSYVCVNATASPMIPSQLDDQRTTSSTTSWHSPTTWLLMRLLPEEQSLGRGAVAGGDNKEHDKNHDDQQHVTSYSQRHPNYYYTNGDRVSSNTKSAYSYYDYNDDDDSYYTRNNSNRQRNEVNSYTTKLSDVYWCLLIALGWTIWMIHSIASLRQQHYNTMLSLSERGMNDTAMMMHTPNADTMRIFRTNYSSLLLVRGHVLDVIPKPITTTDTPVVSAPTCTVVIDYVVERQQQPLLSPNTTTTAGINTYDIVTTLPTIDNETVPPNEVIQIRKHFETTQANLEVGFGNVELLVLPNDPMCSILKYDYDEYARQEERIQRVILLEQNNRDERRRKRQRQRKARRLQSSNRTKSKEHSTLPVAIITENDQAVPTVTTTPDVTRPAMHIDTNMDDTGNNNKERHNDNDDDDDMLGCDVCSTYCDWNYDQYQWKRLSLFFAVLLVIASVIGTVHVVSRMDPKKKYLGWMSFWIGVLFLFPTALWIHRIMIACHRWSESEPEKQGYIVQSSTITSFNNYNNNNTVGGESEPNDAINHKNATTTVPTTSPTLPTMMTLADACMKPSCSDMMDDICDPHCRNHTLTHPQNTSKSKTTQAEFSYVVPEMSGCYFIHYPKKDHYHHRSNMSHLATKKRVRTSKHNLLNTNRSMDRTPPTVPALQVVVDSIALEDGDDIPSDDHPTVLNVSQQPPHDASSSSATSCIMESESSISSISSNDDPTMTQLSMWNHMAYDI